MQPFTDLAFLATYAGLSVATFAFLQHMVLPPERPNHIPTQQSEAGR